MTKRIVLIAALLAIAAGPAFAVPLNPLNVRPLTPSDGFAQIQAVLEQIYGSGSAPDAQTGQQAAGMWSLAGDSPAGIALAMQSEYGGYATDVAFGIWSGTSTTGPITTVAIFSGPAAPFTSAQLFWASPTTLSISGSDGVNVGTYSGIDRYNYGFYITTPTTDPSHIHYSLDQVNHNGDAQMLTYGLTDDTRSFFFEDLDGTDRDNFADLVVSTLPPAPEPGSILLFGAGMIGLASAARRRLKK